jgi:hypothetical protein
VAASASRISIPQAPRNARCARHRDDERDATRAFFCAMMDRAKHNFTVRE